jgi:hypothetical protein
VEAIFLPTIRIMELLFPPVDPVVTNFPLALLGYGDLYLCVFSFYFFCSGWKAQI